MHSKMPCFEPFGIPDICIESLYKSLHKNLLLQVGFTAHIHFKNTGVLLPTHMYNWYWVLFRPHTKKNTGVLFCGQD